jgi:hypothetical protein
LRKGAPARLAAAFVVLLALTLAVVGRDAGADNGPVHVNIADVQVNETDGTATLAVTLDGPPAGDFTLDYATADGTATAPGDYTSTSGTLHFTSGDGSAQSVTVPIVDNGTPQPDHTFTVALGNSSDGTLGQPGDHGTATVTIVDSDWQIAAPKADPAKAGENGGTIDFAVNLNGTSDHHQIKVDYAVTNDSAHIGSDYKMTDPATASGTLTFDTGDLTKHIKVTGIDDGVYGPDKNFKVTLSNPVGATLASGADQPVTGTIQETDAPPPVGISDCLGGPITAGADASFLVRSRPSQLPVTMHYTTVDDTTVAGDYDAADGDLTIPAGSTQATIVVHTHANPPSGNRSFHVQLSNVQNAQVTSSSASCTIQQPSSGGGGGGGSTPGSVSIADPAPVVQPAAGGSSVNDTFTVTYHPPAAQPPNPPTVTVTWTTHDGTATSPADYSGGTGTLTWAPGETGAKTFTVKVNPTSATGTPSKTFTVTIAAQNATVAGSGTATAQILAPGSTASQLSIGDATGSESIGSMPVVVTLAPAASGPVSVAYATADGSATAGNDYTTVSGTLTFAPGETSKTVDVRVRGDVTPENDEQLFLRLQNARGASVLRGEASGTIADDDQTADLGMAVQIGNSSSTSPLITDALTVSNGGPGTATDVTVTIASAPLYSRSACNICKVPQLAAGESVPAGGDSSWPDKQTFFGATAAARQREPQPADNTVTWTLAPSRRMGMTPAFLTPGATATIHAMFYLGLANVSVSDPSVISVSPMTIVSSQYGTMTVTALKPGVATVTVGPTSLQVLVAAAGTTPRWPDGVGINPYSYGARLDQPLTVTIDARGTAPVGGAHPTGIVTVTSVGQELARTTLRGGEVVQLPFYAPAVGTMPYQVAYSGDANFQPQMVSTSAAISKGRATITGVLTSGAALTCVLSLRVSGAPTAAPTGSVTVQDGRGNSATAKLTPGSDGTSRAQLAITFTVNPDVLSVDYSGDALYESGTQQFRTSDPRRRATGH